MKIAFLFIVSCFVITVTAQQKIIVAADGSGDYQTIQSAFNSISEKNNKPVTVFVKKGIYKEKLFLDSTTSLCNSIFFELHTPRGILQKIAVPQNFIHLPR